MLYLDVENGGYIKDRKPLALDQRENLLLMVE